MYTTVPYLCNKQQIVTYRLRAVENLFDWIFSFNHYSRVMPTGSKADKQFFTSKVDIFLNNYVFLVQVQILSSNCLWAISKNMEST